ncbi:ABC transporter permease [Marinobacter lutaoensis]|uniref:ABC transporter permease n=1 Tax=Marinobacter lutaoensis TaxID=135739 RepID=A0A1V2DUT2_9GAMM|nr:iron ABC transporter permease [Marinobacter lutaoensis]ONF44096.1 ABC transporter permease [Marinobacter lutaoensis]
MTGRTLRRRRSPGTGYGLLAAGGGLLLLMLVSLGVGARGLPVAVILDAFLAFDPGISDHLLVRELRFPRTLVAVLVGGALGVAGVIMQAVTRNPLADPGLLGINAGAALAIVAGIALGGVSGMAGQFTLGCVGAGLASVGVYLLGGLRQGINPVRVVLAGAAVTVMLMALAQILIINSQDPVFDQFRHWAVGSLQGRGRPLLLPLWLLVLAGMVLAGYLARALDLMALGGDLGRALGLRPRLVWLLAAVAIVLLAGAATAAAGPISFVGLAAPHLARGLAGPDHHRLLPCTALLAALLTLFADILGRLVIHPGEVGVGIMVALIGGPFFIAMARRRRLLHL